MEHYNDEKNKAGAKVIFMIAQLAVLSVVYIIVYTSFLAVGYAIEQYDVSPVMYFPVFVARPRDLLSLQPAVQDFENLHCLLLYCLLLQVAP